MEDARGRPLAWREGALAFLGFVVVAVGLTWPLASAPARLGTPNMDAYGNIWAICWVARQLFRDPAHLFDSNMFHPYTKSLAYAESLVPQALQAWPVLALGGPPLLAYNLVLLLNLAGSAFAAYVLAPSAPSSARTTPGKRGGSPNNSPSAAHSPPPADRDAACGIDGSP